MRNREKSDAQVDDETRAMLAAETVDSTETDPDKEARRWKKFLQRRRNTDGYVRP